METDRDYLVTLGIFDLSRIAEKIGIGVGDILQNPKGIIQQVESEGN